MNKKADIITISFFVITAIIGFINLYTGDMSKVFKAVLLLIVIAITKLLFTKTFLKKSKVSYYGFLFFEFISIFLANLFGFYNFSYYDKFLHLFSGILLALFGVVIYLNLRIKSQDRCSDYRKDYLFWIFPLIFAIAMAGVWEIWEFSTDNIFGLNAQNNSLLDTMTDIICGTIGGFIISILIFVWQRKNNIPVLGYIIDKMIKDSQY